MTLSNPLLFAIFPWDLMDRLFFLRFLVENHWRYQHDITHAGAKGPFPLFQPDRVRSLSDDLRKVRIRIRRTAVMVLQ